jgi:hypothetical protein
VILNETFAKICDSENLIKLHGVVAGDCVGSYSAGGKNILASKQNIVRSEVLTAVLLKTQVFWDDTLCRLVSNCRRFEVL